MTPIAIWWTTHAAALATTFVAFGFEWRTKHIPNLVSAIALGLVVPAAWADGHPMAHAGGFLLGFVLALAAFRSEMAGGGAVKLAIGLSAALGLRTACFLWVGLVLWFFGRVLLERLRIRLRGPRVVEELRGSTAIGFAIVFAVALQHVPWIVAWLGPPGA